MKQMYGQRAYVQSAGVKNDMEIDGFSVAVCQELGIEPRGKTCLLPAGP